MADGEIVYPVDYTTLLKNRRLANAPLNCVEYEKTVELHVPTEYGIYETILKKDSGNQDYQDFINNRKQYCNSLEAIALRDHRVVTHNFADSSTWINGAGDSTFTIAPEDGKVFIVTFMMIRFPKKLKLESTNRLTFKVWLSPDGISAPVPVINLQYGSLKELRKKSNTPTFIPPDIVEDMGSDKMIEMIFHYADNDTLKGSPIRLHSSLNEKIEIYLEAHQPVKDISGGSITDDCIAVANGKQVIEF